MPEDVRKLVAGNIQRLRKAAGISQAGLAELMGCDRSYISGLEQGKRNPSVVTLWHAARALHVDVRAFFNSPRRGTVGRVFPRLSRKRGAL